MTKLPFGKLGISKKQDVVEVQFGENKIEVLQYLDIKTKNEIIYGSVYGSVSEGIVNEVLLDAYLHVFIVENYTNITFTGKQKEMLLETFDILESNEVFAAVIGAMAPGEYEYIFSSAKKAVTALNEYNRSIAALSANLDSLTSQLVGQTE